MLTFENGRVPLAAIVLTVTWGFYAYFKRSLPVGPNQGFLLEILILTPAALGYLLWLAATGQGHFMTTGAANTGLLLAGGFATARLLRPGIDEQGDD